MTDAQRAAIVQEAKSWIGTPYRGWSCLKGMGVDCGQLVYGVYRNCGLLPMVDIPKDYCLLPGVHSSRSILEDLFLPHFREITEAEVRPGDPVLYKTALRVATNTPGFAHAVIVIRWPDYVLHCCTAHGDAGKSPFFKLCPRRFLTLRDEFC